MLCAWSPKVMVLILWFFCVSHVPPSARSNFNPAVFALNEMLKQQLAMTRRYIESSRRLHSSLVQSLEPPNYRYTTLEETKEVMHTHTHTHTELHTCCRVISGFLSWTQRNKGNGCLIAGLKPQVNIQFVKEHWSIIQCSRKCISIMRPTSKRNGNQSSFKLVLHS